MTPYANRLVFHMVADALAGLDLPPTCLVSVKSNGTVTLEHETRVDRFWTARVYPDETQASIRQKLQEGIACLNES